MLPCSTAMVTACDKDANRHGAPRLLGSMVGEFFEMKPPKISCLRFQSSRHVTAADDLLCQCTTPSQHTHIPFTIAHVCPLQMTARRQESKTHRSRRASFSVFCTIHRRWPRRVASAEMARSQCGPPAAMMAVPMRRQASLRHAGCSSQSTCPVIICEASGGLSATVVTPKDVGNLIWFHFFPTCY